MSATCCADVQCLARVAADVQCLPRVAADVQCNIAPRVALLTCSVATHNSRAMYRNCRHCSMQKYLKKQQHIKIFGYSIEEKKLLIISFANREQLSCTGIVLTRKFIKNKKNYGNNYIIIHTVHRYLEERRIGKCEV